MAENGVNGHRGTEIEMKVGLMNSRKKYLTAESFGSKVNAEGQALKKKQTWVLEFEPDKDFVYLRNYLNRYLTVEKYGKVEAQNEERDDSGKFEIKYSESGQWGFFSQVTKSYLFDDDEEKSVSCFTKKQNAGTAWDIQIDIHPQVHLYNVQRKRYAHVVGDGLECTEDVPWGSDALIFLDFADGKYTIKSFDNRYMNGDGELVDTATPDCYFWMEIRSGNFAFKNKDGMYLTTVGTGKLKCKGRSHNKDTYFTIEESHPQVQILSHNDKSVSTRQGVDVSANQSAVEIQDTEIFQMEYNKAIQKWAFLGKVDTGNNYWNLTPNNTVQAVRKEKKDDSFFKLAYQEDGTVGIVGNDDKYLSNRQTGVLYSYSNEIDDVSKFRIIIINRPILVLKCEFGFVGIKGGQYTCSKAKYDILKVEHVGKGEYTIQGPDNQYWNVGEGNIIYPDPNPSKFQFQFCGCSTLAIQAPDGKFIQGEQNGLFKANAEVIGPNCCWEF